MYGLPTTKEQLSMYGSLAAGALAPIVATRYLLFPSNQGGFLEEAVGWGGSTLINIIPLGRGKFSLADYGAFLGGVINISLRKERESNLVNIAREE